MAHPSSALKRSKASMAMWKHRRRNFTGGSAEEKAGSTDSGCRSALLQGRPVRKAVRNESGRAHLVEEPAHFAVEVLGLGGQRPGEPLHVVSGAAGIGRGASHAGHRLRAVARLA